MSPFRDVPHVELGPLDVGLEAAAARAMAPLPRGGRLLAPRSDCGVTHGAGVLGSAGLVIAGVTTLVAWSAGWQVTSVADLGFTVPVIVFSGVSLAAVLRAIDRTIDRAGGALVSRGDVVGKRARGLLRRLARLEAHARHGRVDAGRASALGRAIAASLDPEIATWIPRDVRGRAELLQARVIAASAGPAWCATAARRREVLALLAAAAKDLDDATPAHADLAELARVPAPRASRSRVVVRDEPEREADEPMVFAQDRPMRAGR